MSLRCAFFFFSAGLRMQVTQRILFLISHSGTTRAFLLRIRSESGDGSGNVKDKFLGRWSSFLHECIKTDSPGQLPVLWPAEIPLA